MKASSKLCIALDVPTPERARVLVAETAGQAGLYKIGSQLFAAGGPDFVRELVRDGRRIFLDLKFHDIPNTVASAVAVAADLGVRFVDVHASGGAAMIEAAARALGSSRQATELLAITVLTSHRPETLAEIGVSGSIEESVVRLARLAKDAGAHGVVASPHEVALVRQACGPDFVIVTPGIRPQGAARGDQARATTPSGAIRAGSDVLVVGRPIIEAPDPKGAALAILREIESA